MAEPFGKQVVLLEMADMIFEGDLCIINNLRLAGLAENVARAGFRAEIADKVWY